MKATIITIGDEILIGQIVDTNSYPSPSTSTPPASSYTKRFRSATTAHRSSGAWNAPWEIPTSSSSPGGSAPPKTISQKDPGRNVRLRTVPDQRVADHVKRMLEGRGIEFNELNRGQAMVPACCTVLFNAHGTAPGMWFERKGGGLAARCPLPRWNT